MTITFDEGERAIAAAVFTDATVSKPTDAQLDKLMKRVETALALHFEADVDSVLDRMETDGEMPYQSK